MGHPLGWAACLILTLSSHEAEVVAGANQPTWIFRRSAAEPARVQLPASLTCLRSSRWQSATLVKWRTQVRFLSEALGNVKWVQR